MINYFRTGLARSAANFPRPLAIKPYRLLLETLIRLSGLEKSNAWLRNSLALDYWELGLSDLDLSIWNEGGVVSAVNAWRKVIPYRKLLLGGEVQVYSSDYVDKFIAYANPWELRRDPHLLRKLEYQINFTHPMHLTVFLVRMLLADTGLRKNIEGRQRKWREHLRAMQLPVPRVITWEYLVDLLHTREPFLHYQKEELGEALLKTEHDSYNANGLDRLINANHHVWDDIVQSEDQFWFSTYPSSIHEFLAAMVEWEIWGVFSLGPVTEGLDINLLGGFWLNQRRLIRLLKITQERKESLLNGIDLLENFYRPITDRP